MRTHADEGRRPAAPRGKWGPRLARAGWRTALFVLSIGISGCQTAGGAESADAGQPASSFQLRDGDVIRVTFPGARDLDTDPQQIRRDGKITLPIVGEVQAAGYSPVELQNELESRYASQLRSKDVVVTVVSSPISVFIDGAVLRAGEVSANHPLTVLDAVMEAGGFDYDRADTSSVRVIRESAGGSGPTYYTVDLRKELDGESSSSFYLAPGDIVHVPRKFVWF